MALNIYYFWVDGPDAFDHRRKIESILHQAKFNYLDCTGGQYSTIANGRWEEFCYIVSGYSRDHGVNITILRCKDPGLGLFNSKDELNSI